ncbi:MAG: aminoglycoside phosphotransferase family protein, partial [Alphaproteobacteria bacterium]
MSSLAQRCRDLIVDLKLGRESDAVSAAPLAGGVSSDIARVEIGGACYCAKFALEKLKVDAEWRAPVRRNAAEYRWLEFVGTIAPESVPRLYGRSEKCNGFVMEFLGASDVRNWKNTLLQRGPGDGEAQAVGALLGRIHGASAAPAFDRAAFRNHEDFWALRLEPYLQNMIAKHPDLAVPLHGLIARYRDAECALIHGDVSPKNILFRGCVPVLLDAE